MNINRKWQLFNHTRPGVAYELYYEFGFSPIKTSVKCKIRRYVELGLPPHRQHYSRTS